MRDYLKRLRVAKGLTMQQMALELNISRQYYQMIENGERQQKMDLSLVKNIAQVLDVSLDFIANEEEKIKRRCKL